MSTTTPEYQAAHYGDDRTTGLIAGSVFLIVAMVTACGLRVVGQLRAWGRLGLDDYLILGGLPLNIALCTFVIAMAHFGLGKHQWRVNDEDRAAGHEPPHNLIWIFHFGYLLSVFQPPALTTIKFSILVYYHRVFTGMQKLFHQALWFNAFFVAAWYIGSQITTIYHCDPIDFFWNRSYAATKIKPPHPFKGSCFNSQTLWVPIISISIVSDAMILFLPYLGLRGLQMPTKRKAGFLLLFALGVFVCVAAGIRLYFAMEIINDGDISWANAEAEIWYCIESCVGLVCACIPTFASLFADARRRRRAGGAKSSSQGYSGSRDHGDTLSPERAQKSRSRYNAYGELDDDYVELVEFKTGQPQAKNTTKIRAGTVSSDGSSKVAVRDIGHKDAVGVQTDVSVYT